jgi:glutathione S-transferase
VFTAVDAFYAPVAFRIQTYGLALDGTAALYAHHLLALPSLREWEAGALAEPYRQAAHEDAVRQSGTVLEDLRAEPSES